MARYVCPKCGSDDTFKEKIMRQDTMDRECRSCGYLMSAKSFEEAATKEDEEKKNRED